MTTFSNWHFSECNCILLNSCKSEKSTEKFERGVLTYRRKPVITHEQYTYIHIHILRAFRKSECVWIGLYARLNVESVPCRPTRIPHSDGLSPSLQWLGSARSIHGIASWFSEGSRLSSATPDGALLARSLLSRQRYSPTGSPTAAVTSLSRPPSLSLSLSVAGSSTLDLAGRQLRNNNNAVRRCSMRCATYTPTNDPGTMSCRSVVVAAASAITAAAITCWKPNRRARIRIAKQSYYTSIFV